MRYKKRGTEGGEGFFQDEFLLLPLSCAQDRRDAERSRRMWLMMLCKWRIGEKEGGLDENEVLHSRSCATGTAVREINHLCICLTICANDLWTTCNNT